MQRFYLYKENKTELTVYCSLRKKIREVDILNSCIKFFVAAMSQKSIKSLRGASKPIIQKELEEKRYKRDDNRQIDHG